MFWVVSSNHDQKWKAKENSIPFLCFSIKSASKFTLYLLRFPLLLCKVYSNTNENGKLQTVSKHFIYYSRCKQKVLKSLPFDRGGGKYSLSLAHFPTPTFSWFYPTRSVVHSLHYTSSCTIKSDRVAVLGAAAFSQLPMNREPVWEWVYWWKKFRNLRTCWNCWLH